MLIKRYMLHVSTQIIDLFDYTGIHTQHQNLGCFLFIFCSVYFSCILRFSTDYKRLICYIYTCFILDFTTVVQERNIFEGLDGIYRMENNGPKLHKNGANKCRIEKNINPQKIGNRECWFANI